MPSYSLGAEWVWTSCILGKQEAEPELVATKRQLAEAKGRQEGRVLGSL